MFLVHPSVFTWDLLILLGLTVTLALAIGCFGWLGKRRGTRPRRLLARLIGWLGLAGFVVLIYGSFVEPRLLVIRNFTVPLETSESLKIAVISDLHTGPYKHADWVRHVVQRTNQLLPDIILLPGDFIYGNAVELGYLEPLADLNASLGIYAVLGNHDMGQYQSLSGRRYAHPSPENEVVQKLEDLGITVLRNEHELISLSQDRIVIAGIDDLWSATGDVSAALQDLPSGTTVILLSHNPGVALDPISRRADLIVSGHTHGGQIRLPGIGSLVSIPTDLGDAYDQGTFRIDQDTVLAITRGAGESSPRARLFAWPEIMMIHSHEQKEAFSSSPST